MGDRGMTNPSTGCLRQPAARWPTRATPARSLWPEAPPADPHVPAADVNPFQHDDPDPGEPLFAADPAAEAAVQPCEPAPDVPPEPVFVGPLLMKPAGAPDEPVAGLRGGPEPTSGPQAVPQKKEPLGGSADEAFVRV